MKDGRESEAGFEFDERYAEAVLHRAGGHVVWGVRLRPFSAWHQTVLEYRQSPFLTGGEIRPCDVRFFLEVCCLGFPDVPWEARTWWERVKMESRRRADLARGLDGRGGLSRVVADLREYLLDYVSLPRVVFGGGGRGNAKGTMVASGAMPDLDQTLMDVAVYRRYTGCPREEPWDLPLGELAWMSVALARAAGVNLRVVTTVEDALLERLRSKKTAGN